MQDPLRFLGILLNLRKPILILAHLKTYAYSGHPTHSFSAYRPCLTYVLYTSYSPKHGTHLGTLCNQHNVLALCLLGGTLPVADREVPLKSVCFQLVLEFLLKWMPGFGICVHFRAFFKSYLRQILPGWQSG